VQRIEIPSPAGGGAPPAIADSNPISNVVRFAKCREQKIIPRSRLPPMKKPGAVSRPGAIREFQFTE
jgi:hypothetical protein